MVIASAAAHFEPIFYPRFEICGVFLCGSGNRINDARFGFVHSQCHFPISVNVLFHLMGVEVTAK